MKSSKIFALALAALTMTACSDSDDSFEWNTASGVTVAMGEANVEVMENLGIFTVPVVVTGDANGYVQVTVELEETGSDPAMANVHYYLTSNYVNIPQDSKTGSVEFKTVDFRGLDPDRTFIVRIVDAKGASIAANNYTLVQIDDKGSSPLYAELAGTWFMSGLRYNWDAGELNEQYFHECTLACNNPTTNEVVVSNAVGEYTMTLIYDYDDEEKWGELVLPDGSSAGPYGAYTLKWGTPTAEGLPGAWNSKYTSATFGTADDMIYLEAYSGNTLAGYLDAIGGFTLTKMQTVAE